MSYMGNCNFFRARFQMRKRNPHAWPLWSMAWACFMFLFALPGCFLDPGIHREQVRRQALDLYAQGEELERKGEYAQALDCFLKSIDVSPRPASFYHAGRCHARLGHSREALDYFDRALAIAPDYDLARAERDLVARQMEAASASTPTSASAPTASPVPTSAANASAAAPVSNPPATPTPSTDANGQSRGYAPPDQKPKDNKNDSRSYRLAIFPELAQAEASINPSSASSAPSSAPNALPSAAAAPKEPADLTAFALPLATPAPASVSAPVAPRTSGAPARAAAASVAGGASPLVAFPPDRRTQIELAEEGERLEQAAYYLEREVAAHPKDWRLRLRLARLLTRLGRLNRAEAELRKAAEIAPEHAEIWHEWGGFYISQSEWIEAERCYRECLRLDPAHLNARNNLGVILVQRGDWEEAYREFRRLATEHPDFPSAYLNLAIIDVRYLGRIDEAISHCEQYLHLGGARSAEVRRWRQELLRRRGDQDLLLAPQVN